MDKVEFILLSCLGAVAVLLVLLFGLVIATFLGFNSMSEEQALDQFKEVAQTENVVIVSRELLTHNTRFNLKINEKSAVGRCIKNLISGKLLCWYYYLEEEHSPLREW